MLRPFHCLRATLGIVTLSAVAACTSVSGQSDNTVLRIVPGADLAILDPYWTTATVSQDHGYMIYDTLFGMTADGRIQPQMVDRYDTSADGKTWTFTLRDGLEFHDGQPGHERRRRRLAAAVGQARYHRPDAARVGRRVGTIVDTRTFRMRLNAPYGTGAAVAGKARRQRAVHHAEARGRHTGRPANRRLHGVGPVHLQTGRMETGREGGLRQEPAVCPACRSRDGDGGRQDRPRESG
jgi:hypothetical protein